MVKQTGLILIRNCPKCHIDTKKSGSFFYSENPGNTKRSWIIKNALLKSLKKFNHFKKGIQKKGKKIKRCQSFFKKLVDHTKN